MRLGGWEGWSPGGNSIHVLLMKLNTEELKRRRAASVEVTSNEEMAAMQNNAKQCMPMQQTRFENARGEIKGEWQWKTVCASRLGRSWQGGGGES